MREVNRWAIVVIPKQPLLDWLQAIDEESSDMTLSDVQADPTVYLIPPIKEEKDVEPFLRARCKELFDEQLASWILDDTLWPIDRCFEVFSRWFAVSLHSIVYDFSASRS
jgi:hypothetical protein